MRMTMMMRLIRRRVVVIGAGCPQNRAGHTKNRKKDIDKSQPEHMATFKFFERSRQLCRGCGLRAAQSLKRLPLNTALFLVGSPLSFIAERSFPFNQ
jgi:hypothetical protein